MIDIEGQSYKIGIHGKVFKLDCGEWILTHNFTQADLLEEMRNPKPLAGDRVLSDDHLLTLKDLGEKL